MPDASPQDLVIFQCAFVYTGEGTQRRPRLLILSAPSVEGASASKIAESWIAAAKQTSAFPVVNDLIAGTVSDDILGPSDVAKNKNGDAPVVRVNRDHPAFKVVDDPDPDRVEVHR